MKVTNVNAMPRSKWMKYYATSGQGSSSSSAYVPPSISIDSATEIVINESGTGNVVQSVRTNASDNSIIDVTYSNAGQLTHTQTGTGNTITALTFDPTHNTLSSTLDNRLLTTITQTGTGNTVLSLAAQSNALVAAMGTRMASLSTNGTGNAVGSLSYNSTNGTLTQNMTTVSGGASGINFVAGNQNASMTKNLTYNSGTNTLTETRSDPYSFNYTGTGNTVTGWSPSSVSNPTTQSPQVDIGLGYRVNAVAAAADTSAGAYFRCANSSPSITNSGANSTLNLPYKQLVAGSGISISSPSGSSNVTISATGGGSTTANIQDMTVASTGNAILKMQRFSYFLSSNIILNGYETYASAISKNSINMTEIWNYFPSITLHSNPAIMPQLSIMVGDSAYSFSVIITNNNSATNTIPAGTEINILCFGI